jgi:hypothetical protein
MLKNMIAPVQAWLLSQNRCVGCGTALNVGEKKKVKNNTLVICKCKRIYIFEENSKKYRRALISEMS